MNKPQPPLEFEVLQERILEGVADYASACAEAEAWYLAWRARNPREAAQEDLWGFK